MANRETDTRVVEMQFDAKDFDKNIRKSQKTLEDFKKSLKFDDAAGQMESTTKNLTDMDSVITGMAANIKKLTNAFTGVGDLGTYIAQKVQKAWHGAANSVERFIKSMTSDQIKEGQSKYEKLLKSIMTIKNATGEAESTVYDVMNDLNKYTDETSYNFADMAQNIGKFTTAGIGLRDAEKEMEGIANWAALAGQGVNEAQRAMYNISQAMSAGYMLKIDYKSIQNASMDTRAFRKEALKAAVETKALVEKNGKYLTKKGKEVNLDNFVETLQFKWFDKATMEKVFKTFADNTQGIGLEAYKAAQRCTTFTDVLQALKDMLSTGWMKSYEHIFGKLTDAMALFSGMCNKASEMLSKFVELRNGILERWNLDGGRDSLWSALVGEIESPDGDVLFEGAYGLLDALQEVGNLVYEGFANFVSRFMTDEYKNKVEKDPKYLFRWLGAGLAKASAEISGFVSKIRDFFTGIPEGADKSRFWMIESVVEAIYSTILIASQIFGGVSQLAGELVGQLQPAIDTVLMLISYISQLITGSVESATKKNTIGNFFHAIAEALRPVTSIINVAVRAIGTLIAAFLNFANQSGLFQTLGNLLNWLLSNAFNWFNALLHSGVFSGFITWIQNLAAHIPEAVQKVKAFGAALVASFKKSKTVKNFWALIKKTFGGNNLKEVWQNIKTGLSNMIKDIPSIIPQIQAGLTSLWNKVSGIFDNFFGSIIGFFLGSAKADEAQDAAMDAVIATVVPGGGTGSSIGAQTSSLLQQIKEGFHKIWDPIKNFLKEFFTKTIPDFFNGDTMKGIRNFFEGTNFKDLLSGATGLLKWLAVFRTGSGLVSMGKGVKSVGKGIKIFGKNLKNLNLANIFSNMFNISNVINSNNSDSSKRTNIELGRLGNQLLQIAAAIGILTLSAVKLASMKEDDLKKAGISIGVMLASLLGAGWMAKRFAGNGGSLLALAAALWLIIKPMQTLMTIPWRVGTGLGGGLIEMVGKLAIVMLAIAGAARIAKKVQLKGLVGMAVAINLLMFPLKELMKIGTFMKNGAFDFESPIFQGLASLAALVFIVAGAARLGGGNKLKGLISFAAAMIMLLIPIKTLGEMDPVNLAKGVGAIEILIMSIAGLSAAADGTKIKGLAGIVAALTALSVIGWLIGKTMSVEQALVGFGPIVAMIAAMSWLIREGSKLKVEQMKKLSSILWAFTAMIAVMGVAIVALTMFETKMETVLSFLGGIAAVLVAIGIMIKLAEKMDVKGLGVVAAIMVTVAAVIGVAGFALIEMSKQNVDWGFILSFFGGLAALVGVIGGLSAVLSGLGAASFVGIAALAAGVVAILGVVSWMVPILMGSVGEGLSEVSAKLKTVSGLLQDFFERTASIPKEQTDRTLEVFDSLKQLILKFVGFGNYTADIINVTGQLTLLGTGLELFFVNDDKVPDPENSMSFKALQKFIDIGPSLSTFNVGTLPGQLMYLGTALGLFNTATSGITSAEPVALSLLQGIFGQADNIEKFTKLPLDTFTSQMTGLGGAMSLYAKGAQEVTGLGEGDEVDVGKSVGILKAVCDAISGEDGTGEFKIPDNMPDSTAMGLFAGQLESLGNALSTFATAAKGMETDTSKAMALLRFLATIGGYVTDEKLKVTKVFTDNGLSGGEDGPLGQFALDIGALGTALSSFATNIKEQDFGPGLAALDHFQDLNSKLTKDNLEFTKAFSNAGIHVSALNMFATDIGALGRALKSFAENVVMDNGTQADFSYALRALDFMADMSTRLDRLRTKGVSWHSLIEGNGYTLGDMSSDMQQVGQALSDLSNKIEGAGAEGKKFNYDSVIEALTAIEKMIAITNQMSLKDADGNDLLTTGTFMQRLTEFFNTIVDADETGYGERGKGTIAERIANFAADLSTAFANAGTINESAVAMFSQIASSLHNLLTIDPKLDFEYPGQMIAKGISVGIRNGESEVVQAAIDVVQKAIDAANKTADVGSPSRVFEELGQFMDLGLINGLKSGEGSVQDASANMMDGAIDRASMLMGLISQAMEESTDLQPTITPVLDLSNLTGANTAIGSMLGTGIFGLDLGGALSKAAAATANSGPAEVMIQNPTDLTGISAAMATLQTQLENLSMAVSNMKIVLNTGVIAGGVTDDVDLNLGMKSFYASRRN